MNPLTPKQFQTMEDFQPPKYTRILYKWWLKIINKIIWLAMVACFPVAFLQDYIPAFAIIKIIFFVIFGIGLVMLSAYLVKHFYTKKIAKSVGLTLKEWNHWSKGMTWKY